LVLTSLCNQAGVYGGGEGTDQAIQRKWLTGGVNTGARPIFQRGGLIGLDWRGGNLIKDNFEERWTWRRDVWGRGGKGVAILYAF